MGKPAYHGLERLRRGQPLEGERAREGKPPEWEEGTEPVAAGWAVCVYMRRFQREPCLPAFVKPTRPGHTPSPSLTPARWPLEVPWTTLSLTFREEAWGRSSPLSLTEKREG